MHIRTCSFNRKTVSIREQKKIWNGMGQLFDCLDQVLLIIVSEENVLAFIYMIPRWERYMFSDNILYFPVRLFKPEIYFIVRWCLLYYVRGTATQIYWNVFECWFSHVPHKNFRLSSILHCRSRQFCSLTCWERPN